MAPLFKDGAQLMRQGRDLALRGDFASAAARFTSASERFRKKGEAQDASIAAAYARLLAARPGTVPTASLRQLAQLLRSLGPVTLQPGPRGIAAEDLARELELTALERELQASTGPPGADGGSRAIAYQQLATAYREFGDRVLYLPELFEQRAVSAPSRVPIFSALAEETMGEQLRMQDPLQAAEHFQAAHHWWRQASDAARADSAAAQVSSLSLRVKCWFCGREGIGHGVQFVSMGIDFDPANLRKDDGSAIPSVAPDGSHIYACKGCGSAVRILADRIATEHVAAAEARLTARIESLRAQVAHLRGTSV